MLNFYIIPYVFYPQKPDPVFIKDISNWKEFAKTFRFGESYGSVSYYIEPDGDIFAVRDTDKQKSLVGFVRKGCGLEYILTPQEIRELSNKIDVLMMVYRLK